MPQLIDLERHADERGTLVCVEAQRHVPFKLRRAFWISDVPAGATRGQHAHKKCEQLLIPVAGSLKVRLAGSEVVLDGKDRALYVAPYQRIEMTDFSPDCVLLVLASECYDPSDYVYD